MLIWRFMDNLRRTMESGLWMISPSTLMQEVSSRSSPSTTSRPLLPHRQTLIMITPEITPSHDGIDLHLGQKTKVGGRYTDITRSSIYHILSVLCISMFPFFLSFCSFLLCSCFSKHKKTKNISVVSSFSLLGFNFKLHFENPKTFCFVACFFCSCFKIQKSKNICCSSSVSQSLL